MRPRRRLHGREVTLEEGVATMGKAWDAAQEYFRCMHASDAEGIEQLFAEDAVLCLYDGTVRRGRREIRDFYANSAMRPGLAPEPQPPIEDGNRCAVEIMVRASDGTPRRPLDVFTVNDDGEITILRAYTGHVLEEDLPPAG
jgi:ketosteroid isomerase-like protein